MELNIRKQFKKIDNISKTYLLKDENAKKWEKLKGAFIGKRAFLIGNGPSLNETPLFLLKNEYTLCFNRFHMLSERINWEPTFYMCVDPLVLVDTHEEIKVNMKKYKYSFLLSDYQNYFDESPNLFWTHRIMGNYFSKKLPLTGSAFTVAFEGLQVLAFLGFSQIYLIGVDQNYQIHKSANVLKGREIESQNDDDPNHFDPRYFGKGRKYHQPDQLVTDGMLKGFNIAKVALEKQNIKIYNAGYKSSLDVYPRVNFKDLFNYTKGTEESLLFDCVNTKLKNGNGAETLYSNALFIKSEDKYENLDSFFANIKEGKKIIFKSSNNHIPFGPIEDKLFFVNRNLL